MVPIESKTKKEIQDHIKENDQFPHVLQEHHVIKEARSTMPNSGPCAVDAMASQNPLLWAIPEPRQLCKDHKKLVMDMPDATTGVPLGDHCNHQNNHVSRQWGGESNTLNLNAEMTHSN